MNNRVADRSMRVVRISCIVFRDIYILQNFKKETRALFHVVHKSKTITIERIV